MLERTLVILKPDALEKGLHRSIHDELVALGLTLKDFSVFQRLPDDLVRAHYAHLADKPYFPRVLAYMTRGPSAASVWSGEGAVAKLRALVGATHPYEADPRSLRGRYGWIADDGGIENVLHCSATPEEAAIEIARFFPVRPA